MKLEQEYNTINMISYKKHKIIYDASFQHIHGLTLQILTHESEEI